MYKKIEVHIFLDVFFFILVSFLVSLNLFQIILEGKEESSGNISNMKYNVRLGEWIFLFLYAKFFNIDELGNVCLD